MKVFRQLRTVGDDRRGTALVEYAIIFSLLSIGAYFSFLLIVTAIFQFSKIRTDALTSAATTTMSTLQILNHNNGPVYQP